jgi:hypothetical protein
MIIPTPEFDPLFAHDGIPFQQKMCAYIRREFADLLGSDVTLPDNAGGPDQLSRLPIPPRDDRNESKAA